MPDKETVQLNSRTQKRKPRMFDSELTPVLLFLLVFCALAVVFTFRDGGEVLFYAGFPMLSAAAVSGACLTSFDSFSAQQIRIRMERKRFSNALIFYHSANRLGLVLAVILFLVFFALSSFLGTVLLGYPLVGPVFRSFAPGICLLGLIGILRGFLRGIGKERMARLSLWIQTALFLVFGICVGIYGSIAGQKVSVLLRNDGIRAVYCACGIGIGFSISSVVIFLVLLFLSSLAAGRIRHERDDRDDLFAVDNTEDGRELFRYCTRCILPSGIPALICLLGFLVGYRLWLNAQSSQQNLVISRWGGFMGAGYPIVTGCALAAAMPFTAQITALVRDAERVRDAGRPENAGDHRSASRAAVRSRRKALCSRLSMTLRLSAYVSIPLSAFLFGAAKEIIGMFPNLTFRSIESAVLTLKAGSFQVFLLQSGILMLVWFWRAGSRRMAIIALSAGFFAQIVMQVILNLAGVGVVLNAWSLDLFLLVYLVVLYCLGKTELIRGMRLSWLMDDALIAVCALLSVIPVELLNDYLLLVMKAFPAFVIELVVFYVLFIILSIVLRAADLRNIRRIPGGGLIRSVAVLLGAAGQDE